ncbi:MAG: type II toxin-antitoxin system MqsA family antitoxin [Elusimicrobia bacterium]|nr:type II toxin-antitoxin system MqsA family antitoxin [Elusimicrobiota bacterium]
MRRGETTLELWIGGELLVIKDVPADVCRQCDEAYISAKVSGRLDHFLAEHHRYRPDRYIGVPEYSALHTIGR